MLEVTVSDHPLSPDEFKAIYSRVPRVCVDLVLMINRLPARNNLVLLTKRTIDPKVWHLPGGTLRHGESIHDAAARVAARELGLSLALGGHVLGVIEYPSHHPHGDSPIGIAYMVPLPNGNQRSISLNEEASDYLWASDTPEGTHTDQCRFIRALFARGEDPL